VTRDRARKQAIRARMASRDEPYSVAARRLAATDPPGPAEAARPDLAVVTACVQPHLDWSRLPDFMG